MFPTEAGSATAEPASVQHAAGPDAGVAGTGATPPASAASPGSSQFGGHDTRERPRLRNRSTRNLQGRGGGGGGVRHRLPLPEDAFFSSRSSLLM